MPLAGAGPDSVIVKVPVTPLPTMNRGDGDVDRVKPTFTGEVAGAKPEPGAEAVIDVKPAARPVTVTGVLAVVCPAAMEICAGETVATAVFAVVNDSTTVLAAGLIKLTGNKVVFPGVTETLAGTFMLRVFVTVTLAVADIKFPLLAWIVVVPGATPVTNTVAVVEPAPMVAVLEPTVATAELADVTLKVMPPAGAGPERVRVRLSVAVPGIERVDGEKLIVPVTCTV
jgi:hypothetical protein